MAESYQFSVYKIHTGTIYDSLQNIRKNGNRYRCAERHYTRRKIQIVQEIAQKTRNGTYHGFLEYKTCNLQECRQWNRGAYNKQFLGKTHHSITVRECQRQKVQTPHEKLDKENNK